jgi:hypothetical protein
MKKNLFLVFAFVLAFVNESFTQKLEISWGESFDSATDIQKILGFSGEKMVTFSTKGKKRYIETFNKEGYAISGSTEYILPKLNGLEGGLLNITLADNNVFAILYAYDKKTKSFSLHTQKLTIEGKPIGKTDEIYASDASDEKIKDRIVDVRYSPDNSKVLVFFDRTDKDRLSFFSDAIIIDLDNKDAVPVTEEHKFPMREAKSEAVSFKMYHSIDNEGAHFYMMEKIEFTKKVISNFTLSIEGYKSNGEKIGDIQLTDEGNVLLSPTIVSNKGKYHVVGYYMTNPKKRAMIAGYSGLFVADLEADLSVNSFSKSKFEDKFFLDLYSAKRIKRMNDKGNEILVPAPYTMDNIILHADGTMTVLSEYYLVTIMDNGKGQRTTTTNYGSIIYFKLNAEGDILASDVIKKNQISSTTSISIGFGGAISMFVSYETKDNRKKYWSYAVSYDENNVFLVFNDHVKNMEDEEGEISASLTNPAKSIPYLVTISDDGSFTKKGMAETSDEETYCVPQITYHLDNDEFIIWGVRRKENKFGEAEIK